MIRINLLPHREERRKALRTQFFALAVLVALAVLIVWFVGYTFISGLIDAQQDKNRFLQNEIAILDKQNTEITKLQEQTESLLQRKQVIESLQVNRAETVHLFNELAHQLPPGLYLKSIKQEGQKVNLTGYAQSNARVSTLMHNLDESPLIERPELVEIKAVQLGKRRMSEFNLNIYFTRQTSTGSEQAKNTGGAQ